MSDAAPRLSDAELASLTARLNARPLPRDPSVMAAPSRRVVDMASHRRQPLGLRPVIEPEDEPEDDAPVEAMSETRSAEIMAWRAKSPEGNRCGAHLSDIDILIERAIKQERKSSHRIVDEAMEAVGEFLAETVSNLRKEFGRTPETPDAQASLRVEIAELKAALAEARAETRELKTIQEGMRSSSRGERGEPGTRGVAGRDGQQGPAGPAGPKGESGARAASFLVNPAEYSAALILSDGSPGAQLRLRPLFERFAEETSGEDGE